LGTEVKVCKFNLVNTSRCGNQGSKADMGAHLWQGSGGQSMNILPKPPLVTLFDIP